MSSGTGNGAIMRSEIAESVQVASRLIANRAHYEAIGAKLAERRPSVVVVAGRGTSDHAAIYARYLLEHAPLTEASYTIEAGLPSPQEAECLAIAPGAPCLVMTRCTVSGPHVASLARLVYPGLRYSFNGKFQL